MTAGDLRVVHPAETLEGTICVPGDKSISHRAAMLAGLASGEFTLENFLCSEDCLNTVRAVGRLGAGVRRDGLTVHIRGTGGRFQAPDGPLDFGNSGTGIRLMAGLLAAHPFASEMTGDASLCSRPMRRIQEPLERMGARVGLTGPKGCAPVRIAGGALQGLDYAMPVASAQVKSCVLLAGLFARGRTTVVEPLPSRDHTERLLAGLGVDVRVEGARVSVDGTAGAPLNIPAGCWRVPGDFSSAAFWLAAAACRAGARVTARAVGLNPRRTALLDVLRRMGAEVAIRLEPSVGSAGGEPAGEVTVTGRGLSGTTVGGGEIPNLIDELPMVAVAGALAQGETVIRDAAELRVKESDRIAAVSAMLRGFGVDVWEEPDGLRVRGGRPIRGGCEVDSRGDHRIAMAGAVLALAADAPVTIRGVDCIATSYPSFWQDASALGARWE